MLFSNINECKLEAGSENMAHSINKYINRKFSLTTNVKNLNRQVLANIKLHNNVAILSKLTYGKTDCDFKLDFSNSSVV